ncbi:MAG: sugar ABC transporter ATP-binding protein [Bradyrhizobium sp.]|nr:MAG: sugar ABC transporter ATP-binding protein [Bradyrhizobium sp.]
MADPALEARGLTKRYGDFVALNNVDFRLQRGEVRALIGSNGAGKSTLIKILTGAVAPTAGVMRLNGEAAPFGDPGEMIRRGVGCIYQHSNLAPAMTVLDNIFLGRQPTRGFGLVDRRRQRREATALLAHYGVDLDLDAAAGALPTVKQKEVEIMKALALDASVLLMDEPTGWLAATDVRRLHDTIRQLKSRGVGVVYISHMLDEIFSVCDTMTILRDGVVVAESDVAAVTRTDVVRLMVGERLAKESGEAAAAARRPRGDGRVRLAVRDFTRRGVFQNISFDLHAGEILCITGLIGSKRTELLRALFGADPHDEGRVEIDDRLIRPRSPASAMAEGLGLVPEDRHRDGLMLGMSVAENLVMTTLARFVRVGLLDRGAVRAAAAKSIDALGVQPRDGRRATRLLSGGNQQKVLVGKWLNRRPEVLILDEPTVGVDVGAKAEIYAILRAERDRGTAVLVVSSDLEEVMTIADRIGVMASGRLTAIHDATDVTLSRLVAEIGAEP